MRYFFLIFLFVNFNSCNTNTNKSVSFAVNPVVAHRGAWKAKNLPENSIASLKHAIELGCTGSEFDVRMTLDHILIITHDADYAGLNIEQNTYATLAKHKLPNGETLPTLKEYILAGMENNSNTGLFCEIKPSKIEGRNVLMAEKVLALVDDLGAEKYISYYISFSYEILKKILEINPKAKTQYLDGSKAPHALKSDEISGLDYAIHILKKKPEWILDAKKIGLKLNAWTANETEDLDWLISNNFNYITTNEPELLFERLKTNPAKNGWNLIWSDEFNYSGKPDITKFSSEVGFKRNQELQYYTDSLKNARVEKGYLILEAHKEMVKNEGFTTTTDKNWRKNKAYANYSSGSLTTKNLAEWTYGRIDIRAKLPKGVGMWPAFWMLGENYGEIGWPECGEIDIMEHVGFEQDSIFGTIHTKAYNHTIGTQRGKKIYINQPYNDFHVFTLIWTPEKMNFILDDVVYNHIENEFKTTAEWPFDQNFHLKLNIAIGGMLGGQKGIDDSVFPQKLLIDYIRVYQQSK